MQFRSANAERIVDVLIRTCSVSVERDGEALNANSCHRLPPFRRLMFKVNGFARFYAHRLTAGLYGTWEPCFELFICSMCMASGGPLVDEFENATGYHSKRIDQLKL